MPKLSGFARLQESSTFRCSLTSVAGLYVCVEFPRGHGAVDERVIAVGVLLVPDLGPAFVFVHVLEDFEKADLNVVALESAKESHPDCRPLLFGVERERFHGHDVMGRGRIAKQFEGDAVKLTGR